MKKTIYILIGLLGINFSGNAYNGAGVEIYKGAQYYTLKNQNNNYGIEDHGFNYNPNVELDVYGNNEDFNMVMGDEVQPEPLQEEYGSGGGLMPMGGNIRPGDSFQGIGGDGFDMPIPNDSFEGFKNIESVGGENEVGKLPQNDGKEFKDIDGGDLGERAGENIEDDGRGMLIGGADMEVFKEIEPVNGNIGLEDHPQDPGLRFDIKPVGGNILNSGQYRHGFSDIDVYRR
jgi:hypothetical protein